MMHNSTKAELQNVKHDRYGKYVIKVDMSDRDQDCGIS